MKTTEVFIEQVIIGCLVIFVGCLPFHEKIICILKNQAVHAVITQLSIGAIVVGCAYLIGIVYDRFADTLFQDLERLCRLSYVLKSVTNQEDFEPDQLQKDPFPEYEYRHAVLSSNRAADKESYLRTRLRLTRSLASILPAMAASTVYTVAYTNYENIHLYAIGIVLVYFSIFARRVLQDGENAVPKTNSKNLKTYVMDNERLLIKGEDGRYRLSERRVCILKASDWMVLLPGVGMVLLTFDLIRLHSIQSEGFHPETYLIPISLYLFELITIWAWWRIYHTYFSFIRQCSPEVAAVRHRLIPEVKTNGMEYEARFLVCGDGWRKERSISKIEVYQGYLSTNIENVIRIRVVEKSAILTLKGKTIGIGKEEYEFNLDDHEKANVVIKRLCKNPIEKTRHKIKFGKYLWEVDEYKGVNQGLITAEVEFSQADEYQKLQKSNDFPKWVGKDITRNQWQYTNMRLSEKPFGCWSPDEKKDMLEHAAGSAANFRNMEE